MVNIGTGNMLLQDDDLSIPHKGLALAFRRTYNSQSTHDANATEAADFAYAAAGMYGNGWTNTFDAHLSRNVDSTVFTVFDGDGGRYDYDATWPADQPNGVYTPRAGNHGSLVFDGNCGFLWTKKNGTTYYFYRPGVHAPCAPLGGTTEGYAGRLYQIVGRNRNTYISLAYSWDNGVSSLTGKIAQIAATTESGLTATLTFADVNGHRLLQQLTYPDGVTNVQYGYDANGNLVAVSRPTNNSSGTRPTHMYSYQALGSGFVMYYAGSPRMYAACGTPSGCYGDGAVFYFGFGGTSVGGSTLSWIQHAAVVNPAIPDGTSSGPLQGYAYPSSVYTYEIEYYTTGGTTPTFRDTAGHMANWVVDGVGRPTQSQACTASANQGQQCTGTWLRSNETWDGDNNRISATDNRGNQSDFAYDANGNLIAAAAPSAPTTGGTFRPTALYSYDVVGGITYNNVTSVCDPRWSHAQGRDWNVTGRPAASETLCPTAEGGSGAPTVPTFTYFYPSYEPFGVPAATTTASGFHTRYSYATGPQQGADYGLPTDVTGDAYTQTVDNTTHQEHISVVYDQHGRPVSANTGNGTATLSYDALGRQQSFTDADGVGSYRYYNADSSLARSESSYQHASGTGVAYTYDLDGNVTTQQHHFGGITGVTTKWYDGTDRLLEVQQPRDSHDLYPYPWLTRYLYDLTQGGTITTGSAPAFSAYGGLAKTQEYVPNGTAKWGEPNYTGGPPPLPPPAWRDIAATAFDAVYRSVTLYRSAGQQRITNVYDTPGKEGSLDSRCNAINECSTYSYDVLGHVLTTQFNTAGTPNRSYAYDEDGRMASVSSANGSNTVSYDVNGLETSRAQSVNGAPSATVSYSYFPDGTRSSVGVSGPSNWPGMLAYAYRADGKLQALRLSAGASATWSFGYTAAGRPSSRSDTTIAGTQTYTYDTNGRLSGTAGPVVSLSALQFDAEDELTTQTVAYACCKVTTQSAAIYTSRGELAATNAGNYRPDTFANGMRIPFFASTMSAGVTTHVADNSFDPVLAVTQDRHLGWTCVPKGGGCSENDEIYDYDPAGRLTAKNGGDIGIEGGAPAYSKSYDAEDHLLQQGIANGASYWQTGYVWGPTGHPVRIGSTSTDQGNYAFPTDFQYDALYYDDDTLLFTTNSAGQVDSVMIGDMATYVPAQGTITTFDRDASRQMQGCHNQTGYGFFSAANPRWFMTAGGTPQAWCTSSSGTFTGFSAGSNVGRGGILWTGRSEGFTDGYNAFQGVRTYDTYVDAWNTPDLYRGVVHDPASQKPYMWNYNNPYNYSDPTGFVPAWDADWDADWNQKHGADSNGAPFVVAFNGSFSPLNIAAAGIGPGQVYQDAVGWVDQALKDAHATGEKALDLLRGIVNGMTHTNNDKDSNDQVPDSGWQFYSIDRLRQQGNGFQLTIRESVGREYATFDIQDNSVHMKVFGSSTPGGISALERLFWFDYRLGWPMFLAPQWNGVGQPVARDNSPGGPAH